MDIVANSIKLLPVWLRDKAYKLLHKAEVDRAVFFGILTKIWSVASGPLIAFIIIIKLSPEYQGYYYTFASLLTLQTFVELGLSTVIIQFASHEWSKLRLDNNGRIAGDREALSRLTSLADITFKWYLVGGTVIVFGLGLAGYVFFLQKHAVSVNWVLPWFSLCFFTGINLCLVPFWSLLEGCNQVKAVYAYRFFRGIVVNFTLWLSIFLGAKLWSASISVAAVLLLAVVFLRFRYWNFIRSLLPAKSLGLRMDWRREIFPIQWRVAVCWVSAYLVSYLFTPIIFYYHGPVIAGQFGITWSIIGAASMMASSWLYPRVPRFGMLIAQKKYKELDSLFWRITKVFMIIMALSAAAVWFVIYALNKFSHPFAARFLPLRPATLFLITQTIIMTSLPFSAYLRAHKREPFLLISILGGVLTALSTFILGKYYSVTAIGFGYLAINVSIVPFIFLIWRHCRRRWHYEKVL